MSISVIGLGKLGSPLAAVLASKGYEVIGFDVNPEPVRLINEGLAPVEEPQLQSFIDASRERLSATADVETAILNSSISFVIVPTPSTESGEFTNKYVLSAMEDIGRALRKKDDYHLVVITSTVMPGSTGGVILDTLERCSGRRVGQDVGLCYNPEFIALGSVINDMLYPDFILIGESDSRAGEMLENIYKKACGDDTAMARMNFVNAELTKISVNTFVTTKISYANMLSDVCDRLPEADVDVVTAALGKDSRIGGKYLKGALGYGGPCFPRDNVAFSALARNLGAPANIAEATDEINRYQVERMTSLIQASLPQGGTVGVLGLSYKPDTGVTEQAQGVAIARALLEEGYRVVIYDPQALGSAVALLGDKVEAADSADDCAGRADVLAVTTAWPEFAEISPEAFSRSDRRVLVIDCWRHLSAERYGDVADLVYLGKGDRVVASEGARAAAGS